MFVALRRLVLAHVADVKHRLGGDELQHVPRLAVFVVHLDRPRGLAGERGVAGDAFAVTVPPRNSVPGGVLLA